MDNYEIKLLKKKKAINQEILKLKIWKKRY